MFRGMSEPAEPPRLRRETHPHHEGPWALAHLAGLIGLGLGAVGFLVVALSQDELWSTPDWRIAVPFLAATIIAACASIARREGMWALPLVGVGLAASALVLGWFLILAIVILATVVVIVILHSVM
jgi:hypothetical protein